MRVGVLRVYLNVLDAQSLKEKRKVVRSLKDRLLASFNISVAEVGSQDKWQICELGIAAVSSDGRFLDSVIQKVLDHIETTGSVRLIDYETEIL